MKREGSSAGTNFLLIVILSPSGRKKCSMRERRTPEEHTLSVVQSRSWCPLRVRGLDLPLTGQQHRPLPETDADVLLKCQAECRSVTSGRRSTTTTKTLLTFVIQEDMESTFRQLQTGLHSQDGGTSTLLPRLVSAALKGTGLI